MAEKLSNEQGNDLNMDSSEFRETLLRKTLTYVANNVPYYRELPHLLQRGRALTLEDFPIIDKAVISANINKFLVLNRFPDYVISTGGTTDGPPSITFRIEEEYYAAHEYLTGFAPGQVPSLDSIKEFAIEIFFNGSGYYWRKAPGWPIINLTLEQVAHAEVIKNLIKEGIVLKNRKIPARIVQAQTGPLRTLTGYFWVKKFFPRDYGIHTLIPYGSHVSRVWKERLKRLWGANILTSYGLAEFGIGNPLECENCGGFHYKTAWSEFLRLDKKGFVNEGDALLLLTSLVPFVQVQPRIRYLTGDIVTVIGRCKKTNELGFRFRGRAEYSTVVRNSDKYEVLLSELEVIEVLDRLPDIGSYVHASEMQLWKNSDLAHPPFRMGAPRFRITPPSTTHNTKKIDIAIETLFDPELEKKRARELREMFVEVMNAEFPDILDRLHSFGITLNIELSSINKLRLRQKTSI
jgi:phenylacetate-coenzyme A ligase PaaK-like adenylate-forming protein